MKQLLSNGSTFSVGNSRRSPVHKFDPWPDHGNGLLNMGIATGLDGTFLGYIQWQLKDDSTWFYVFPAPSESDEIVTLLESWFTAVVAGTTHPAIGEFYNARIRRLTDAKWSQSQMDAYGTTI
jgi:hypothetical protein